MMMDAVWVSTPAVRSSAIVVLCENIYSMWGKNKQTNIHFVFYVLLFILNVTSVSSESSATFDQLTNNHYSKKLHTFVISLRLPIWTERRGRRKIRPMWVVCFFVFFNSQCGAVSFKRSRYSVCSQDFLLMLKRGAVILWHFKLLWLLKAR